MRTIDKTDRKILLALDTDARASYSQIGKKIGIGKNNVQYRVKRLVDSGVIKKFVVQPSLAQLGLFLGKIYLQLSGYTDKEYKELISYLKKNSEISWVARTEGRWDLMLGAYVQDMQQFVKIKKEFFHKFEKFIASYDIVFLAEGHTSQRTYLLDEKKTPTKIKEFMSNARETVSYDQYKLLHYIANNARFKYTDLANHFNINIKTAQKRIKELESKGIIQGYVTFLDPKKIGHQFFKLCIYLNNHQSLNSIIDYCLELPNVIHAIENLGPWEIELEIETESLEDFYQLTHKIRNDHSDVIKKTESVLISDEIKLDFFPEWLIKN
ncbi:Lrp/AsnC family transcriptional regulator [Nanoarchaeota archaeon]